MKDINSIQSGLVKENDVNNPSVQTYRGKNQFPQSFQHLSTCQYGYVDPVAVMKCEVGDVVPYKFATDLNTFTLKSPLKSPVKMFSAAFKVPMEALYPRTYDYLFSLSQKGDIVPQDSPISSPTSALPHSARAIFPLYSFSNALKRILNDSITGLVASDNIDDVNLHLTRYFKSIFLYESVYSAGSLFSKMNLHFNCIPFVVKDYSNNSLVVGVNSFDKIFDLKFVDFVRSIIPTGIILEHYSAGSELDEGNPYYYLTTDSKLYGQQFRTSLLSENVYYCSIDRAFELLRTGDWNVKLYPDSSSVTGFVDLFKNHVIKLEYDTAHLNPSNIPYNINIEPIIAYQLACIHFFNNPKVDFIYTAQLWRDNIFSFLNDTIDYPTFDYNGTVMLYDICAYDVMVKVNNSASPVDTFFSYYFSLFSFARSLRYGDYFTGARPEPIGVGDINLDEDMNGNISSLEVAKKLQLTRLLHKVAITGPEHSQQIKYIFGGRLPDVPKDVPIRLSLEEFDIEGFEVNNTGSAQLSSDDPNITTTNLRLSDSKFMFEVEINEPCWLVMVQYFEAHRVYSRGIDRFAFHYDIYDDFVPDMQFVGDQDVKQSELLGVFGYFKSPFAYHLRNMEYKQRVSYASGGFIEHLPSWAFITDNSDGNPASSNITPEYLRSSPSEFDRFYKSLLGHSLASRFHFITANTNVLAPWRQMVYAPEILS